MPVRFGRCQPLMIKRSGEHHCSRGRAGAQSVRVLQVWNVETPSRSTPVGVGRPTVRKVHILAGTG
jgi:hypothetical protein